MNIALWVVAVLLAGAFAAAGAGKLTKTNTGGSSVSCAIVRRGNSSSDLTTLVRFFGK